MDNSSLDLDTPPSDVNIPSDLTADLSTQPQPMDTVQMLPFPFCLLFNSKPWQTITVAAPSPELAALTIEQFVQLINETLVKRGYPPNMCSARSGSC